MKKIIKKKFREKLALNSINIETILKQYIYIHLIVLICFEIKIIFPFHLINL